MTGAPSLSAFSKWLSLTPASLFIQTETWVIPITQITHILAIAVVLSSVGMVNLRILGLAGTRSTIHDTAERYVPWLWGALAVLLTTGLILIVGEPQRDLSNRAFQSKMVLVIVLVVLTIAFRRTVARRARVWDESGGLSGRAKAWALGGLAVALTIAVLGRWIAYALTE